MIAELEQYFDPGPVPRWFHAFDENRLKAIDDLLFGRFYMDSRNTEDPEDVLIDWANLTSEASDFQELLDRGLEQWVQENWGKFPNVSSGRLAIAWCRLADVVAFVEGLERTAGAFLERFEGRENYLGALSDGPSRDALGRYLFAIARYQKDRSLASFWWELCDLNGKTPFYHGRYAISGLRGLPAQDPERGGFRSDVAAGLLKLGRAVDRLVTERVVSEVTAEEFFVGVGWHTVAAYPPRSRWRQIFAAAIKDASERLAKWFKDVLPDLERVARNADDHNEGLTRFNREWQHRAHQLQIQLAENSESVLPEAEKLIAELRAYAEASGDVAGLSSVFGQLSRGIRSRDPVRAAAWAEESKKWNPWDPRGWTNWIKALQVGGAVSRALAVAWDAQERFPENAFVSTELTHLLLESGRLEEAEQIALEGVERFPENAHCRGVLTTVLRQLKKYPQAEIVCREALKTFGDNHRWWTNLAQLLVLQNKLRDAELELKRAVDKFPNELLLWNFLGAVLGRENKLQQSEEVLRKALLRFGNAATKSSLAVTIRRQGSHRLQEALSLVEEALRADPGHVHSLMEKAKILGDLGQFEKAEVILEEVRGRHPELLVGETDLYEFLSNNAELLQTEEADASVPESEQPLNITLTEVPARPESAPTDSAKSRSPQDSVPKVESPGTQLPDAASAKQEQPYSETVATGVDSATAKFATRRPRNAVTPSAALKPEAWKLVLIVSEARLLRKWARRNELTNKSPAPPELRRKAARLLEEVLSQESNHPKACLEKGNLLIESGMLQEAQGFLEERIALIPSALGLRQALARVNRELAHEKRLQFDPELYVTLTKPLVQLQQRDPAFRPLAYLGRGRTCLAMMDGHPLRTTAAKDFEHLRKYLREKPTRSEDFLAWWNKQIGGLLFANVNPEAELNAENIGAVELELGKKGRRVDALEEDFTLRMSH